MVDPSAIEAILDEEIERQAHETRREAKQHYPVKSKACAPQDRMNLVQKAMFWSTLITVCIFWTTPWLLLSIPGLFLLVAPGLLCMFLGIMPMVLMLGWYWGDPLLKERRR